ncbi:MAG: aminopeptidase [Firmicutes bacterium]|nr:aminopeptidase [Bacillota bacterium]
MEQANAWNTYSEEDLTAVENLGSGYKKFLNDSKTERECVKSIIRLAEEAGYVEMRRLIAEKGSLAAGDKVYLAEMGKTVAIFNVGSDPIEKGLVILGAHIDSPRLDVKQNPLYEEEGQAYLDTHYYGGIKKYQWVTLPMAIHGVVAKKDGSLVEINIGEKEDDPAFCITDLLIHLAGKQQDKKAAKAVEGEDLDLLIGSRPLPDTEKDAVKENILKLLAEKYDINEDDLVSAELEIVPAGPARDAGFDRSMVLGYGHDDKVCAYSSLIAMLHAETRDKTTCCIMTDKEEIGSVGATGAQSRFFENAVTELLAAAGQLSDLALRRTLANSRMLSSDVSAAYDPLYASVFDKRNACYLGKGVVFNKYTGSRGKYNSNDANAEYVALIRRIMDDNKVAFQTAELGKVDEGGGGTIAYILALYGMEVIDCGVAVLNMHAPWEIISKADLFEAVKCYNAFLAEA